MDSSLTCRRFVAAIAVLVSLCLSHLAVAGESMRYQFKADSTPVYEITIKAEMPDADETRTGHLSYTIHSVDPSNGQIIYDCVAQLQTQVHKNENADSGFATSPRGYAVFTNLNEKNTMIDSLGKVLRATRAGTEQQLPFMLGPVGQLLIQPMSADGADSWKVDGPITLYTKKDAGSNWPPRPMFAGQTPEIENSAHQTITFTRRESTPGTITVERQLDLATDEKVGDTPLQKLTGDGQFVFDITTGLITSMKLKQTIEVNQKNVTARVPVTVNAHLLTGEELKKWEALQAANDARQAQDMQKLAAQNRAGRQGKNSAAPNAAEHFAALRANEARHLPPGATKTAIVGLDGGGPYMKVHPDHLPVIGFTITIGDWGHTTIGSAIPLFTKPDDMNPPGATVCLAKEGYVVGGVIVNSVDGADGLRIIFMKKTANGVDPKTSYKSPWFGYSDEATQTQLDGKGKLIIGTYGFQGMNMNKIGLIVAGSDSDKTKDN